jgi:hypothetical protein
MKEETYLVIAEHDSLIQVEYLIEVADDMYTLKYSNAQQWAQEIRGKTIGSIIDTGNECILSNSFLKRNMDYSLFSELHVLLSFINKHDNLSYKFKFAKIEGGEDE